VPIDPIKFPSARIFPPRYCTFSNWASQDLASRLGHKKLLAQNPHFASDIGKGRNSPFQG